MDDRCEVERIGPQRVALFVGGIFRAQLPNPDLELIARRSETAPAFADIAGPNPARDEDSPADALENSLDLYRLTLGNTRTTHLKILEYSMEMHLASGSRDFGDLRNGDEELRSVAPAMPDGATFGCHDPSSRQR